MAPYWVQKVVWHRPWSEWAGRARTVGTGLQAMETDLLPWVVLMGGWNTFALSSYKSAADALLLEPLMHWKLLWWYGWSAEKSLLLCLGFAITFLLLYNAAVLTVKNSFSLQHMQLPKGLCFLWQWSASRLLWEHSIIHMQMFFVLPNWYTETHRWSRCSKKNWHALCYISRNSKTNCACRSNGIIKQCEFSG